MTEATFKNEFPAVDYDAWRALVEAELRGAPFERKLVARTYEGLAVQPVYARRDAAAPPDAAGFPGLPPFIRGARPLGAAQAGWDLRQEHAHPCLLATNQAILEDIAGGVTSLILRFDRAARGGLDPDDNEAVESAGDDGLMAYGVDDLDVVLRDVNLSKTGIALDSGAAFPPAAAALVALWQRRGIPPAQAQGAFRADPLGVLAREGELPYATTDGLKMMAQLAAWTLRNLPLVTSVCVDTSPYHLAGASAVQDLAFSLATGAEYLRALTAAGLDIDAAAGQITFDINLGTHHFLAIAKLRAARELWCRVVAACGGSASTSAMRIHARTSQRVLTERDPYVNLLRNTVCVFAAGLGGAESITSAPFDVLVGPPDAFSRRIARNTLLILRDEAQLHRVVDPAGGSWFMERYTRDLAERAWGVFQEVERRGGMQLALESGWVAAEIDATFAQRSKDLARRKEGITGVSEFPDAREEKPARPALDLAALRRAASERVAARRSAVSGNLSLATARDVTGAAVAAAARGATIGQMSRALGFGKTLARVAPLPPRRFAEPFEQLRDACDAGAAKGNKRPAVFLANMGPAAHHTARATYSKNFFEAGGFDVVTSDGFRDADEATQAFTQSGARIAVICSSDKLYPEVVPALAGKLKAAGAGTVVLAGNPGENEQVWRAAGVDRFIFIRCDVLATLRELLHEEGVL